MITNFPTLKDIKNAKNIIFRTLVLPAIVLLSPPNQIFAQTPTPINGDTNVTNLKQENTYKIEDDRTPESIRYDDEAARKLYTDFPKEAFNKKFNVTKFEALQTTLILTEGWTLIDTNNPERLRFKFLPNPDQTDKQTINQYKIIQNFLNLDIIKQKISEYNKSTEKHPNAWINMNFFISRIDDVGGDAANVTLPLLITNEDKKFNGIAQLVTVPSDTSKWHLGHLLNEFIEVYYDAKNITEGLTGQYNPITKSYELRTKDTTPNTLRALWVGSKEFQVFHWLITNLISKAEEKVRLQNPNLNLLDSPNEYWAAIQLEIANTDEDEIIKNLNNWSHNYALNYPNPLSSGYNDVVNKIIIPDIMVVYKAHLPVLRNISAKINPKTGKFDFVKKK